MSNLQIKAFLVFASSQSWLMYAFSHSHVTLIILSRNILKIKFTSETNLNTLTGDEKRPHIFSNNIHESLLKQKLRLLPKVRIRCNKTKQHNSGWQMLQISVLKAKSTTQKNRESKGDF